MYNNVYMYFAVKTSVFVFLKLTTGLKNIISSTLFYAQDPNLNIVF
jgi:hypothetical protein